MQLFVKLHSPWIFVAFSTICLCCINARAQTGFVSIDCGGSKSYVDENGISWDPDSKLNSIIGNTTAVMPPSSAGTTSPLSTIRYFPGDQNKYCYVFNEKDHGVSEGATYMIRTSFWAGSTLPYDTRVANQVTFKLLVGADVWDEVSIGLPQTGREEMREIYVFALKNTIDICLTGQSTGSDIRFISSLVLRPLNENLTSVQNMHNIGVQHRAFLSMHRINYGAASNDDYIRYQEDGLGDPYDRIWKPDTQKPILTTSAAVGTNIPDHPPARVLQTAYENSDSFNISFNLLSEKYYHFTQYFSEISTNVTMDGQRVFNFQVYIGGSLFGSELLDISLYTYSVYPMYAGSATVVSFVFMKQNGSKFGPLISGLELFQIFDNDMSLGTDDDEVATLKNITGFFPSLDIWTGDPCLPFAYNWLTCTHDTRPYISKIDLHNNSLTGPIPDFLGGLPALTTLNLDNNNFSGQIPRNLLDKIAMSGLKLSLDGNAYLCNEVSNQEFCTTNSSSNKKGNLGLIVGVAVGCAVLSLMIILCAVFCYKKVKSGPRNDNATPQPYIAQSDGSVFPKKSLLGSANQAQEFSFHDIKLMTDDFKNEIGKGGFGSVYFGRLKTGKNVAVKVLSRNSKQGENEFLNEVELLSRVHHKNLVSLVGYCVEGELVLVYEYMGNGSLFESLKTKSPNLRLWKDRLRVAVDAAEGLDYLHRGCDPSIIHRDVKSSNILLGEQFEGRISDFGISKSRQYDSSTMTGNSQLYTVVQGSFGYLDPVYAETNIATHSIDVYAFGVVLLELVSGKPPMLQAETEMGEFLHIVKWAKPHIERGNLLSLIDPDLSDDRNDSSIWKAADIALMCLNHDRKKRPTMSEVKLELQSALSMELQRSLYDSTEQITSFSREINVDAR